MTQLTTGTRLGPYEILAPIGSGGMGEVFRAKDTRLDRTVAIKVLSSHLSSNPQLRERFDREARAISQLNHPNICTLHDVGHENGTDYLVMELLEGTSLADRLTKGPIPLPEVLRYGAQIAHALDRAHKAGIVHRDLKPGNVMLTRSGAKLLDFGLAKYEAGGAPSWSGASAEPSGLQAEQRTEQKPLTQEGTLLGTFQYMAPEQLEGEEADPRTDIFALGALLYEMATGKRAFEGKTRTSLIAAIVSSEPRPLSEIQPLTPPALEHVIKKCLAKDRDDRWQSAHDIAEELMWIGEAGSQAGVAGRLVAKRKSRERLAWSIAAALAMLLAVLGAGYWKQNKHTPRVMRFSMLLPPGTDTFRFDNGGMSISPDGTLLVMALRDKGGSRQLWLRNIGSMDATPILDTDGAQYPFWSPDGTFIGFFTDGKLKKIPALGGPVQVICDAPSGRGGTWNRDGIILFAPNIYSPIFQVPSAGGTPRPVTRIDPAQEITHRWPSFLPDGRHFIFLSRSRRSDAMSEGGRIFVASLDSSESRLVVENASNAMYTAPDWLVFSRGESLLSAHLDMSSFALEGEPLALPIGKVGFYGGKNLGFFAVSDDGILVYLPPIRQLTQLRWLDREGKVVGDEEKPGHYRSATISPDGKRIAFLRADPKSPDLFDIWLHEIGTTSTSRFTFDGEYGTARWSPDGARLFFSRGRLGSADLYARDVAGSGKRQMIFESTRWKEWFDVSPDGKYLVTSEQYADTNEDLMIVSIADHTASVYVRTPSVDFAPAFSPDGRYVAFRSAESATPEVYVRRFPDSGEQWQVSTNGGGWPKWRGDGAELFYDGLDGTLMAVSVRLGDTLTASQPRPLFRVDPSVIAAGGSPVTAVTSDGQRFLVITAAENSTPSPFRVVLNWTEMLRKK